MKRKHTIIVVDTSLLMNHPGIMRGSKWCTFNVPMMALRQLDGLKDNDDPDTRKRARIASRFIEDLRIPIVNRYVKINDLDNWGDNKIIGTALKVKEENPDKRVLLLTTDRNMRLVADFHDLEAADFLEFVKEDDCPALRSPLWLKAWKYIGVSLIVSAFGVFFIDEVMSVMMFLGGLILMFFWFMAMIVWEGGRRQQSVIEYYDGDSDQDNCGGGESTLEKNMHLGITEPTNFIHHI